ncbi:hypothetical protein ACFV94_24155 [Streptomyces sp. NPDC059896]|uniref:hypothetical protein n=1 Tax=Streptomyces sp. NPDC059896 TaxID=3346993 RepID=UPI003669A4B2
MRTVMVTAPGRAEVVETEEPRTMGYPPEIFEVTDAIIEFQDKYAATISDVIPVAEVKRGLELAGTPAATDKVVITFD